MMLRHQAYASLHNKSNCFVERTDHIRHPSLALQAQAGVQLDRQQKPLSVATNYDDRHTSHVEPFGVPGVSGSDLCRDELGRTVCNRPSRVRIHRANDERSAK